MVIDRRRRQYWIRAPNGLNGVNGGVVLMVTSLRDGDCGAGVVISARFVARLITLGSRQVETHAGTEVGRVAYPD